MRRRRTLARWTSVAIAATAMTASLAQVAPASASSTATAKSAAASNVAGKRVVKYAKKFVGTPYSYGGADPSGFDCSGFTQYVYKRFGIRLPHSATAQLDVGRAVRRSELKPGDLVIWNGGGHVGIYTGKGFLSATNSKGIWQYSMSQWSQFQSYTAARRVLPDSAVDGSATGEGTTAPGSGTASRTTSGSPATGGTRAG